MRCFVIQSSEIKRRLDCLYNLAIKESPSRSHHKSEELFRLVNSFGGGTPSKSNAAFWQGHIPWASPKDFRSPYLEDTEDHISEEAVAESSTKIIPDNSVLVVVRSSILAHTLPVTVTRKPTAINQDIRALIPKPESGLLVKYLGLYLSMFGRSILPLITKHSTTVQSINTDQFSKLPIPLPPPEAQKQVVQIMDAAYETKKQKEDEAERLLNSIDDYMLAELGVHKPVFQNKLSFTISSEFLSDKRIDPKAYQVEPQAILKALSDVKTPKEKLGNLITENISGEWGVDPHDMDNFEYRLMKVIRNTNFDNKTNLTLKNVANRGIPIKKAEFLALKEGDILVEKSGGSPIQPVGRVAIIEDAIENTTFSNFLQRLRIDKTRCSPRYLFIYLKALYRLNYMEYIQNQTTGIKNLIFEQFLSIPIILPPNKRQAKIIEEFEKRTQLAEQLKTQAQAGLETAKKRVEKMIMGK